MNIQTHIPSNSMDKSSQITDSTNKHFLQLDGLRGLAVICVLIEHFLPNSHPIKSLGFYWGEAGVQCFFVLSGFLITRIVLAAKKTVENGNSRSTALKTFYARRAIRIFPLYYLTILACFLLGFGNMEDTWLWHVTYTTNIGLALTETNFGHSAHFWTLAVEEQFYVVFPFLILFIPSKNIPRLLFILLVTGVCWRFFVSFLSYPWLFRIFPLPACMDALSSGALLACYQLGMVQRDRFGGIPNYILKITLLAQMLLMADVLPSSLDSATEVVFGRLLWSIIFFECVNKATKGVSGPIGDLLSSKPLTYIGTISYGIYVLHHFLIDVENSWKRNYFDFTGGDSLRFLLLTIISILLASLSWHLFEKPVNSLKRFFPYQQNDQKS